MKLLILISIVYVNKKGQFKNSIEFYTFFMGWVLYFWFQSILQLAKQTKFICTSFTHPITFSFSLFLLPYCLHFEYFFASFVIISSYLSCDPIHSRIIYMLTLKKKKKSSAFFNSILTFQIIYIYIYICIYIYIFYYRIY